MTTLAAGSKPGIATASPASAASPLAPSDTFIDRHIGPGDDDVAAMLRLLGYDSLDAFSDAVVPASIRLNRPLQLDGAAAAQPRGESELLAELRKIAAGNKIMRSCIGMGYHDCITPAPILRNILENPGWYTQYTPYQAEISQGRLESLLNFQTMIADLTALPMANASLLDEGTAAAEAMAMCHAIAGEERKVFFISDACHPQTINVVRTRAISMGIKLIVGDFNAFLPADGTVGQESHGFARHAGNAQGLPSLGRDAHELCGALVQYPDTFGRIEDPAKLQQLADALHAGGALFVVACDPLALTLIKPPGEFGADIAVGSAQRFGVPMGGGGPHAAFMATTKEHVRKMPGRIVGVSKDTHGNPAYRLAIQTREQHIRREKATSNICTAQVLLANIAAMYAVYHGPGGLKAIARRVHRAAATLAEGIRREGHELLHDHYFDALAVKLHPRGLSAEWRDRPADAVIAAAALRGINLRKLDEHTIGIALDETVDRHLIYHLLDVLAFDGEVDFDPALLANDAKDSFGPGKRTSPFLTHPVFNTHHSEHELVRYMRKLESRDLSLTTSMISLGSCTMKLNGTSEMFPVTWPEFGRIHPFAPPEQLKGYEKLCGDLEKWLAEVTGFAAVSLQPNAGSQGEYAGLLAIRAYHESRGQGHRNICLIPVSAHGTNPASAVIAGFHVVTVACDDKGNIDVVDLLAKAAEHKNNLACLMITYPSTHGVFEADVKEICRCIHDHGGQVYMDGANMNAQVGLTSPGHIGADVCHLNLHKTFCIPHGGGGPGMGPIGVAGHLAPFLPGSPLGDSGPLSLEGEGWGEGENVRQERGNGTGSVRPANVAYSLSGGSDPHPSPLPKRERGPEGSNAADADASTRNPKPESRNPRSPGPVSAAPWGSASILPISWVYIALMGGAGLKKATQVAILNANYMAKRLSEHYPVLFTAKNGTVAHEFIIDCRQFEATSSVKVEDIAKRLMDYGFHAPTMSFPVPGTLMIEPTESEPRAELDRFVDALIAIRGEIRAIEEGKLDRADNPLKHAPHTAPSVANDNWPHKYSRQQAAYPAPWLRDHKFWPYVGRIDNPWGDRNLFCACPPVNG